MKNQPGTIKKHENRSRTMKNQPGTMKNQTKNVTHAGSQLTWEGGGAGITKNVTNAGSQLTF